MTPPGTPLRHDTVSFLSDYGRVDEFVGVVHSILHAYAPGVTVVDITHDLPPFDVRAAGLTLARSAQYLNPGVVLAIVDPAVGSPRRAVAVEVGDGASVLLGPDNGVLAPAVALVGGATRAVVLDNEELHLPAPGPTFAGRDIFAPVAAALCNGMPLEEAGSEIDPMTLLPGTMPLSRLEAGVLHTEVLWVDRYGNAQLNLDPDDLDELGRSGGLDGVEPGTAVELEAHGRRSVAHRAGTFVEVPTGGLGLVVDSYGLVAVVADRASAAEALALGAGDEVRLHPVRHAADTAPGVEVRVELGRTNSEEVSR